MNFVKTSVLKQEFTAEGVKEFETEARSQEQIEIDKRLSKLPEFNRDPQFRSLAEQIYDNQGTDSEEKPKDQDKQDPKYAIASVTEDDVEFYESLDNKERGIALRRQKEDEDIKIEFAKARELVTRNLDNSGHSHPKSDLEAPSSRKRKDVHSDLFSATKATTTARDFVVMKKSPIINKKSKLSSPSTLSPNQEEDKNIEKVPSNIREMKGQDHGHTNYRQHQLTKAKNHPTLADLLNYDSDPE